MEKKKIIGNTIYTMSGNLIMNGVLQLAVYPLLHRMMGSEELGTLLFLMGLVAILCPSIGQSLNTSRLVLRRDVEVTNGDYDWLLLIFGAVGSVVALLIAVSRASLNGGAAAVFTAALIFATLFRYYGDVEYRLSLHYKQYLIYYLVLTAGYLLGFVLYRIAGLWYLIFLTGEALALLYVGITGSIFRNFWERSPYFSLAFTRGGFLLLSYLVTNLTLNIDRLALNFLIDSTAVTQYYVVSLIGKTMVLLVVPVNTIIISYLTKRKERLNPGQFLKFVMAGLGVSAVFFLAAQIGTPIFVRLFYPALYTPVKPLITIVNLSQVLGLYSAYLFIIVLTFTGESWQLGLQLLHLGIIAGLVLILTGRYGIRGFSLAVLAANAIRVVLVVLLGFLKKRT